MNTLAPSRLAVLALLCAVSHLAAQAPSDSADLPPAGFGTLRQEQVAVRLATGSVQLRVLPLDERIIRLLAPDTYASLRQLRVAHADDVQRLATQHGLRRPDLFLVTFFGLESQAEFSPEDLTVTSQNRLFRPAGIIPLSAQWSVLQLKQRETASAIYLFEEGIVLLEPLTVSYDGVSSSQWEQALRAIEMERARVDSRAAATPQRN
jgi:hypothetical protein